MRQSRKANRQSVENGALQNSQRLRMKVAYADPPYLGCGSRYVAYHPDALDWDDPARHQRLVTELCDGFPDGWAMSLSSPSLRVILPMCPDDCRVSPWFKPFAVFKPNVGRDGFADFADMTKWFRETHGLPFIGQLIEW